MKIEIRHFAAADWKAVVEIYRLGLQTGNATFETEVPDFDSWNKKFRTDQKWVALTG